MLKDFYNEVYSLSKYYKQPVINYNNFYLVAKDKHPEVADYDKLLSKMNNNIAKIGWWCYTFYNHTDYISCEFNEARWQDYQDGIINNKINNVMIRIYKELNNNNCKVGYILNKDFIHMVKPDNRIVFSFKNNFNKHDCHEIIYYQIRKILINNDNEIERIYNNGYFKY